MSSVSAAPDSRHRRCQGVGRGRNQLPRYAAIHNQRPASAGSCHSLADACDAPMARDGGGRGPHRYGPRFTGVFRQRARLVARVLRGAKPADIPVEQPTIFELVVNLKTTKAIGHEVPAGLVLRADKVIE